MATVISTHHGGYYPGLTEEEAEQMAADLNLGLSRREWRVEHDREDSLGSHSYEGYTFDHTEPGRPRTEEEADKL